MDAFSCSDSSCSSMRGYACSTPLQACIDCFHPSRPRLHFPPPSLAALLPWNPWKPSGVGELGVAGGQVCVGRCVGCWAGGSCDGIQGTHVRSPCLGGGATGPHPHTHLPRPVQATQLQTPGTAPAAPLRARCTRRAWGGAQATTPAARSQGVRPTGPAWLPASSTRRLKRPRWCGSRQRRWRSGA